VARFLSDPDKMLAEGDPIAKKLFATYRGVRTPNFRLVPEEIDALLLHIERGNTVVHAGSKPSRSAIRTALP
jgi:hypothetical protein